MKVPVKVNRDPANPQLVTAILEEDKLEEVSSEEFEYSNNNVLTKVNEVQAFNDKEIFAAKSTLFPNETSREVTIYQKLIVE